MELVIFGAQGYALGAYKALKRLYPRREIKCFLVTKMCDNAPRLGGIPVRELSSYCNKMSDEERDNTEVLIATPENVHSEIEALLEEYGLKNHIRLTSERWSEMIKLFHASEGLLTPVSALSVGCCMPDIKVYMARSHMDKPLKQNVALPDHICPIQVGAANTGERIAELTDDNGESISDRNANYCELTGLYWVWKNELMDGRGMSDGMESYYGYAQYRRLLELSSDDMLRLVDNDVDAVLPYPLFYEPDINAHHERYLKEKDWQALLDSLSELQSEYAEAFPDILSQRYLYNYNVIIARKNVLRDYCEWLFPILMRTEELSDPKGSERADRYIGYMGETLETLYFMKNADYLNIVHTGCGMLY